MGRAESGWSRESAAARKELAEKRESHFGTTSIDETFSIIALFV